MVKIEAQLTIEISQEKLDVLIHAYENNHEIEDSEYFISRGLEQLEWEMGEFLESGFYQHYPLSLNEKGRMIVEAYISNKVNLKIG